MRKTDLTDNLQDFLFPKNIRKIGDRGWEKWYDASRKVGLTLAAGIAILLAIVFSFS